MLLCDNMNTRNIAKNPVQHIKIDIHFVRNLVLQKQLNILYYAFENELTDVLTKPLASPAFLRFRSKITVLDGPHT